MTGTSPHRPRHSSARVKQEHILVRSKRKNSKRKITCVSRNCKSSDFSTSTKDLQKLQSAWALAPCRGLESTTKCQSNKKLETTPSKTNKCVMNSKQNTRLSTPLTCSRLMQKKAALDGMMNEMLKSTSKKPRRFTFEPSEEQKQKKMNSNRSGRTWREKISPRVRTLIDETENNLKDKRNCSRQNSTEVQAKCLRGNAIERETMQMIDRQKDINQRLLLEINAETDKDNENFLLQSKTARDTNIEEESALASLANGIQSITEDTDENYMERTRTRIKSNLNANTNVHTTTEVNKLVDGVISSTVASSVSSFKTTPIEDKDLDTFRVQLFSTPFSSSSVDRHVIAKKNDAGSTTAQNLLTYERAPKIDSDEDEKSSCRSTTRLEREISLIEDISSIPHIEYSVLKLESTVSELAEQIEKKDSHINELLGIIRSQERRIEEGGKLRKNPEVPDENLEKRIDVQTLILDAKKIRYDHNNLQISSLDAIMAAKQVIQQNCDRLRAYVAEEIDGQKQEMEMRIKNLSRQLEKATIENLKLQKHIKINGIRVTKNDNARNTCEDEVKHPNANVFNPQQKVDLPNFSSPIPTMHSWNEFSVRFKEALTGELCNDSAYPLDVPGAVKAEKLFKELCFCLASPKIVRGKAAGLDHGASEEDTFVDARASFEGTDSE